MRMLASYLHHSLNHFPIVLVIVAAITLVAGTHFRMPMVLLAGRWSLVAGVLAGVVVAVVGLLSVDQAVGMGVSRSSADLHRNIAIAALAVAVLAVVLGWAGRPSVRKAVSRPHQIMVLLSVAAAGLIGWSAHVGGTMLHPRLQFSHVLGLEAPSPRQTLIDELPLPKTFADQAAGGAIVYADSCAECHGETGRGGELAPGITGPGGLDQEGTFADAADLLEYVSTEMPSLAPGSLSAHEYVLVTAWLLEQSGYEPLFDRSSASGIKFTQSRLVRE
jgi:uncharacterized membrane protein